MNLLLIYFGLVLLLGIFSFIVVSSFWRYRFQGDRTTLVIILFAIAFVFIMGSTLFLLNPGALSNSPDVIPASLDGF